MVSVNVSVTIKAPSTLSATSKLLCGSVPKLNILTVTVSASVKSSPLTGWSKL